MLGMDKLLPRAKSGWLPTFANKVLIERQQYPLVYILTLAAFMLPVFLRQSQVAAETLWPRMSKIFIICLFTEKRKRFLDSGLHEVFPFLQQQLFLFVFNQISCLSGTVLFLKFQK